MCINNSFLFGQTNLPSLKEKYQDYFPIGTAIGNSHLNNKDSLLVPLHFASITAENDMKPQRTIKSEGNYTFEAGDKLVDFAKKNNLLIRGHTLVWYNQTDNWFYEDKNGNTLSKGLLFQRMKTYIKNVLTHYKGDIYTWDVVLGCCK